MPGRPARGRRRDVVVWVLAAEVATAAGAGSGAAVVGGNSLLLILWLVPGLVLTLVAIDRWERYRGRPFEIWSGMMLAVALFLPGFAIGSWIQEATAR